MAPQTSCQHSHDAIAVLGVVFLSKAIVALINNYCPSFLRPPAVTVVIELTSEIKELKEQHRKMDHPDTFVAASKIKRKLLEKEAELKRAQESSTLNVHARHRNFVVSLLEVMGPALLVVMYWKKPMAQVNAATIWPLATIAAFPETAPSDSDSGSSLKMASIGIIPWVFMCQRASDLFLEIVRAGHQSFTLLMPKNSR